MIRIIATVTTSRENTIVAATTRGMTATTVTKDMGYCRNNPHGRFCRNISTCDWFVAIFQPATGLLQYFNLQLVCRNISTYDWLLQYPCNMGIHTEATAQLDRSNSPWSDSESTSWLRNSHSEILAAVFSQLLFLPTVQRLIDLAFRGAVSCSTWPVCKSTPTQWVLSIVKYYDASITRSLRIIKQDWVP